MKFFGWHFQWFWTDEVVLLFGIGAGRVQFLPEARWLYSLRVALGVCKIEVLWLTGIRSLA